ncbi:flagellar hook-associated protein FlgL [bacterium]|nr:flagellar hook-associated protein FlgL [bacterium]
MRVADKMNYNQSLGAINKNRQDMMVYQNQAASQKRINKPSDDPLGAARILEKKSEMQGFEQYKRNILSAKEFIEYSEQSLSQASEMLIRAKELAIDQADDAANGAESRSIVAAEVRQIYEQMVNIANRQFGDRFLFGGYKSMSTPFDMTGTYFGDDSEMEVQIEKDSYITMNMPGSVVFMGKKLHQPIPPQQIQQDDKTQVEIRGPSSQNAQAQNAQSPAAQTIANSSEGHWGMVSTNVFEVLRDLEVGLKANDKFVVQNSLDYLDNAISQINMARGELGSRISSLNTGLETLQKLNVDAKVVQSEIEDVDMYDLVNNLSKTQTQLEASLATSGKMLKTSLLDFLR